MAPHGQAERTAERVVQDDHAGLIALSVSLIPRAATDGIRYPFEGCELQLSQLVATGLRGARAFPEPQVVLEWNAAVPAASRRLLVEVCAMRPRCASGVNRQRHNNSRPPSTTRAATMLLRSPLSDGHPFRSLVYRPVAARLALSVSAIIAIDQSVSAIAVLLHGVGAEPVVWPPVTALLASRNGS